MRESPGIFERNGSYRVVVNAGIDPQTGKRRQLTGTTRTKAQAIKLRTKLLNEVHEGRVSSAPRTTIAEALERWFELASPNWSPRTAVEHRRILDCYLLPWAGKQRKLRDLDLAAIDGLYRDLDRRLAPATVRRIHTVLRSALEQTVRYGWLRENPARHATLTKTSRSTIRVPTDDQVAKLLRAAEERDPEMALYVRLAAVTGARRGEMCGLRWEDVDLDAGILRIRRAVVNVDSGVVVKSPKNETSVRNLALDALTLASLRVHSPCVSNAPNCGQWYIFGGKGDPWRPDVVTHRFARLRQAVGIDGVRLHDLRHYMVTRLVAAGVDVRTIAGRAGHASPYTTLTVYAQFFEPADKAAADLLGKIIE